MIKQVKSIQHITARLASAEQLDLTGYAEAPMLWFNSRYTRTENINVTRNDGKYHIIFNGQIQDSGNTPQQLKYLRGYLNSQRLYECVPRNGAEYSLPAGMQVADYIEIDMTPSYEIDKILSPDQIWAIVEGRGADVVMELWECLNDSFYPDYEYIETDLEKYIDRHMRFFRLDAREVLAAYPNGIPYKRLSKLYDLQCQVIEEIDYARICRNTPCPAMLEMISNYDCMNSNWLNESSYGYEESYFGDMLDLLKMNPALMKKALIECGLTPMGKFPNKKERNGKEAVDYKQLCGALANTCSGANLLTFMVSLPLEDLYQHSGQSPETVIIPKGTTYTLFDEFQGGGSLLEYRTINNLEATVKRPQNYEYPWLRPSRIDGNYGPNAVYGRGSVDYDSEITIKKWSKNNDNTK